MPGYLYPTYPEWARFLASPGLLPAVVILNCGNGDIPWNTDYQALCTSLHALSATSPSLATPTRSTAPAPPPPSRPR